MSGPRPGEAGAWLRVISGTLAIYATIPLARTVQTWVTAHGDRRVFAWIVVAAVLLVVAIVISRIRSDRSSDTSAPRRWWRSAVLLLVASVYIMLALALRQAPEEAVHLLEYAILSALLLDAIGFRMPNRLAYVVAAFAAMAIGTCDEVIQYLIPERYFDFRDVGINALGGSLIQIGIAAGVAPVRFAGVPPKVAYRIALRLLALVSLLWLLCAANTPPRGEWYSDRLPALSFLRASADVMNEFGYRHQETGVVCFSRLDRETLDRSDRDRAAEVAAAADAHHASEQYSPYLERYSPGRDPFAHEFRVHLFRRDRYLAVARLTEIEPEVRDAHLVVAAGEERILSTFFPATYAASGYVLHPADQALLRRAPPVPLYLSEVSKNVVTRFSESTVLGGLLALAVGSFVASFGFRRS